MRRQPTGSEIWIPCEGEGSPGYGDVEGLSMCPMCGRWKPTDDHGRMDAHHRDDILARIKRGDFG